MTYSLLTSLKDSDIPQLLSNHLLPEVSRFIDINEKKYFKYVTKTENVFYYKISENGKLIGSVHCEISGTVLYVSLLIFPEFQNNGFGTKVIKDIISGALSLRVTVISEPARKRAFSALFGVSALKGLNFDSIEISIDKTNLPSLRLFEKVGFIKTSVDGGLVNYTYIK